MSGAYAALRRWGGGLRDPGLRLLFGAVLVAVAALTSVTFFADRVERALTLEGAALLAADLVVEQGEPIDPAWQAEAQRLGLMHARTLGFPSVLIAGESPVLVQVKAVDPAYPLRGRLRVQTDVGERNQAPVSGQAWLEGTLLDRLGRAAAVEKFSLGELSLQVAGQLLEEPDRGGSLFQLAPRLMIAYSDAQSSGLLGPASRVRHRLLLAGDAAAIAEMRGWLETRLPPGSEIADLANARPELRTALERAQRFLSLAALCASLLAGVAIVLATRRYVERALDGAAVLRTLGMRGQAVLGWHLRQLSGVVLFAALAGGFAGLLGQQVLVALVGDWFGEKLPWPGLRPFWLGLLFGYGLTAGFALPTMLRIARVPPLRVLRREMDAPGIATWFIWSLAAAAFFGLMWWQVQDLRLAAAMAMALFVSLLSLMLVGWLLLYAIQPLRRTGGVVALGLAALARYPQLTLLQLGGFGLGITLLLLLAVVRVDIVETWQSGLPAQAPNHFLINLQPDEREALQALLERYQVPNSGLHATTRARLVGIGGREVEAQDYSDSRARRLAAREYSLGFSAQMPSDNRVRAGRWWDAEAAASQAEFSVEQGLADSLGIRVGDELEFDVAGQRIRAPVTSLRSVSWDSFNVNFFVTGSPVLGDQLPVAYLTSMYLGEDAEVVTLDLVESFPSVSVLDLRPLLRQVREVMERGALAVEAVFLFTLLGAVLVSIAAAQVSRDERAREVAVMRTLGASRRHLRSAVLVEFGLLGVLGGVLGAMLASVAGYLIAVELFGLPGRFNPDLWWIGAGGGGLGVALVGWVATRRLLGIPPVQVLNSG